MGGDARPVRAGLAGGRGETPVGRAVARRGRAFLLPARAGLPRPVVHLHRHPVRRPSGAGGVGRRPVPPDRAPDRPGPPAGAARAGGRAVAGPPAAPGHPAQPGPLLPAGRRADAGGPAAGGVRVGRGRRLHRQSPLRLRGAAAAAGPVHHGVVGGAEPAELPGRRAPGAAAELAPPVDHGQGGVLGGQPRHAAGLPQAGSHPLPADLARPGHQDRRFRRPGPAGRLPRTAGAVAGGGGPVGRAGLAERGVRADLPAVQRLPRPGAAVRLTPVRRARARRRRGRTAGAGRAGDPAGTEGAAVRAYLPGPRPVLRPVGPGRPGSDGPGAGRRVGGGAAPAPRRAVHRAASPAPLRPPGRVVSGGQRPHPGLGRAADRLLVADVRLRRHRAADAVPDRRLGRVPAPGAGRPPRPARDRPRTLPDHDAGGGGRPAGPAVGVGVVRRPVRGVPRAVVRGGEGARVGEGRRRLLRRPAGAPPRAERSRRERACPPVRAAHGSERPVPAAGAWLREAGR